MSSLCTFFHDCRVNWICWILAQVHELDIGLAMQYTKLIAIDGKFGQKSFWETLPGMFFILHFIYFFSWHSLTNIYQWNFRAWQHLLSKDHHHLETKVWPENLGLGKCTELQRHLERVLNWMTKVEFEQHRSYLYEALSDRPKGINYLHGYLNCPKSIYRYKILEVRGSLVMVTSSNAEAYMWVMNMPYLPNGLRLLELKRVFSSWWWEKINGLSVTFPNTNSWIFAHWASNNKWIHTQVNTRHYTN